MTEQQAYKLGFEDGREDGEGFSSGMTWDDPALNEAYDRGVNDGQMMGGFIAAMVAAMHGKS